MEPLRHLLAHAGQGEAGASLFETLYSTWCHSAGAAISLCLMSQVAPASAPGMRCTHPVPLPSRARLAAPVTPLGSTLQLLGSCA